MPLKREIYLGFAKGLDKTDAVSVQRQYLPLGKIGGKPAWLNPVSLPKKDQICCPSCHSLMPFLMQVYCSGKKDHCFHRYIYVFACNNPDCYKDGNQTIRVLRCQLPLKNDYTAEQKIDFEQEGEVEDPCYNEEVFAKTCAVCGCHASKFCAKCRSTYYCCVEHQKLDWIMHECNPKKVHVNENPNDPFLLRKENAFVFKEHAMEMDYDYAVEGSGNVSDDDSECSEDEPDVVARATKQMEELQMSGQGQLDGLLDLDETKDVHYKVFTRALKKDPTQVLRYDRHGVPLSATDHVVLPKDIPDCSICGAPRTFEFQLTPHILSIIEERGSVSPIDFGTVVIYTCSEDCEISQRGYAEEYAFRQDFKVVTDDAPPEEAEEGEA